MNHQTPITQKKIAAINDLSGYGRCALTVAIPVISHMRLQCCPVPTSILSNHTGYSEYFFDDYSDRLPAYIAMWKKLDLHFDGIMSGFLGSKEQIGIVEDFIRDFRREDTVVVVDPVMGDHGDVYQTYTPGMCAGTARLAEQADVITPNLTEAALLLGVPYHDLPAGEAGCREIVERLSLDGRRSVVLTGASGAPDLTGAMCLDARTGHVEAVQTRRVPQEFHGTGDVFASVLTGALVRGKSLTDAAREAVEFVRACAERTAQVQLPMREGVDFEPLLGLLTGGNP